MRNRQLHAILFSRLVVAAVALCIRLACAAAPAWTGEPQVGIGRVIAKHADASPVAGGNVVGEEIASLQVRMDRPELGGEKTHPLMILAEPLECEGDRGAGMRNTIAIVTLPRLDVHEIVVLE